MPLKALNICSLALNRSEYNFQIPFIGKFFFIISCFKTDMWSSIGLIVHLSSTAQSDVHWKV